MRRRRRKGVGKEKRERGNKQTERNKKREFPQVQKYVNMTFLPSEH